MIKGILPYSKSNHFSIRAEKRLGKSRCMTGLDSAGKRHARCQLGWLRFSCPSVAKVTDRRALGMLSLMAFVSAGPTAEGTP
jgi:hypothetical protein